MRHKITIFLILLLQVSFLICYPQSSKTHNLKYLSPSEKSKCLIQTDSVHNVNYFINPDYLPQFPGGQGELEQFIFTNAKFDFNVDAFGRIVFEFIVDENGTVNQIKILKGVIDLFDNELIRVLKMMPNWKPGMCDKKNVPVKMKFSIKIELK